MAAMVIDPSLFGRSVEAGDGKTSTRGLLRGIYASEEENAVLIEGKEKHVSGHGFVSRLDWQKYTWLKMDCL